MGERRGARIAAVILWAVAGTGASVLVAAHLLPLPERLAVAGSTVIEFRDGAPAHVFLAPDERWRIPARLSAIDPAYVTALVALEDERFRLHPGVDPLAVVRAALQNLRRGRVVSGASTLTMQLVRLVEPRPRTFRSKLVEAFRAIQLEQRLSKDEILEAYLTFVPYGRNLEGVEAAAISYFGHGADALGAAEIATLLAVPQAPNDRFPSPRNGERLRAARDELAVRLSEAGALPGRGVGRAAADLLAELEATPVPTRLQPFPRHAPHAAIWLRRRQPEQPRLRTTLDRGTQLLAERLMLQAAPEALRQGAHNGVAVVVDHGASEVRGLVGNFDFWDASHAGQVIGFDEPRSPGSALKPFLYAQAIDRGLVLPEFLVADIPAQWGSYSPRNFDGGFSGLVQLEDALSRSLNLPFVALLAEVEVERFIGFLSGMGVRSLRSEPGVYGLSAIIGGLELTPLELAGLYSALAERGGYRPLKLLADEPATAQVQVISAGAAYLTARALSRKDRPDFPARAQATGIPPRTHWKTGTSFGHRDAWAAGSGAGTTAVVWVGNFDGKPAAELTGSDGAGPILFQLLEALEDRAVPAAVATLPPELGELRVCAFSGFPATAACPQHKAVLVRQESVPTRRCPFHVAVDVDVTTGLGLTPACRAGHEHERRSFLSFPASLRRFLADQGRHFPSPPELAPGCQPSAPRGAPRIASPPPGQVAVLIPGLPPADQEVPLEAETTGVQLSWFVDGEFLGTFAAQERVWWTPREGDHEIVVVDETGLSARRALQVRAR